MKLFNSATRFSGSKVKPVISNYTLSTSEVYLREDQSNQATFDVTLQEPKDLTVSISSRNNYVTFDKTSLTFTTANYNTPQTVTVQGKSNTPNGLKYDDIIVTAEAKDYKQNIRVVDSNIDTSLYTWKPEDNFQWDTESDLNTIRNSTIDWIWGTGYGNGDGSLPTSNLPVAETIHTNDTYFDFSSITGISEQKKLTVEVDGHTTMYLYYLVPSNPNAEKTFILHPTGHGDSWSNDLVFPNQGYDKTIQNWMDNGFYVITCYMTVRGPNPDLTVEGNTATSHNSMANLESSDPYINPMKYFLEPYIQAINYAITNISPEKIIVTGISGGGGIGTTWVSFLDQRVDKSFDVAGSYPFTVQDVFDSDSDYEQGFDDPDVAGSNTTQFIKDQYNRADYLDMYCLAAQGKEHYQFNNANDGCCVPGYYNTVYKEEVKRKLNFGGIGTFDAFTYNEPGEHTYNQNVIDKIIELIG